MYSGETTVTNDQLEGVLKAGDILRVRGLWRSNSSSGSKKENIQSNNQKLVRSDKRSEQPALGSTASGQIQKIKLVQPASEKIVEPLVQNQQQLLESSSSSSGSQPNNCQPLLKTYEKKDKTSLADKDDKEGSEASVATTDGGKSCSEDAATKSSCEAGKNKENVETNSKKRKSTSSDAESTKSKSDVGESVSRLFLIEIFFFFFALSLIGIRLFLADRAKLGDAGEGGANQLGGNDRSV